MAPTGQGGQWQEVLCCSVCTRHFDETFLPVSLICGHVICRPCSEKEESQTKPCPHDDWRPTCEPRNYPINVALLSVVYPRKQCMSFSQATADDEKKVDMLSIQISRFFREADSERGGTVSSKEISRTLQRKVIALLCYQWCEPDGRAKSLKMCRGIAERIMIEIILNIQANTHVSSQLWSAVRARGCQFLGPAMQDDVLRLILMTLETGECIARKNLVMYVVQTLGSDYPQVSKTCVGHVVQLLYRASCFNVLKRDGESSLMQLKEEFRTYEALRREHDSQIVQIACESGLRIGPDQWSALLYADQCHRSHMQSIIDKLQSRNSYLQGIDELRALTTSPTSFLLGPYRNWLSQVVPCLEHFSNTDQQTEEATWRQMAESMAQIRTLLRLHCQQDDSRRPPRDNGKPGYHQMPHLPFHHFAPGGAALLPSHEKVYTPADLKPQKPPDIVACGNATRAYQILNGSRDPIPHTAPAPPKPIVAEAPKSPSPPDQAPPRQQFQPKPRYQMGIPPNRTTNYYPPQQPSSYGPPATFYQPQSFAPNPQRPKGPRRGPPPSGPPPPCATPLPMLIGYPTPIIQTMAPMTGQPTGVVVQGDGAVAGVVQMAVQDNGQMPPQAGPPPPQQLVMMQSPTHINGAPVVMIPPPPPSVTPVPMGAMTPQGAQIPVQVPPNTLWTAASPTGSMVFPAASPTGQPPHTIWIQSNDNQMFPMFDYTQVWGPGTMLRESGADAEQLLAKRHEILKRLQPSEDDDDPEDGGIGHVSYTVASSVLDDRMDHHPMGMMPVPTIDLPAIPISFANMPTEETMTMIGEMVQQNGNANRPRAASLTSSTLVVAGVTPSASTVIGTVGGTGGDGCGNGTPTTVQSECGTMSVMVDSPLAHAPIATAAIQTSAGTIAATPIPLVPVTVPVVTAVTAAPEPFNPSVPPPQAGQPMLVDSATGLLTPIRPILVAHPQNVVSISLDKIVDVKERLSEAHGCASEAENAHLRMELRMAESEMNHLDPYTKNNCLLRELQQVDRELQQLQIEPIRQ